MDHTHQSKYGPYGPMVQTPKSKYGPYGPMVQNPKSKYGPYGSMVKKTNMASFCGALTDMEDGVTVRGHSCPVVSYNQNGGVGTISRQALHQRFGRIDVQRTIELVKHED